MSHQEKIISNRLQQTLNKAQDEAVEAGHYPSFVIAEKHDNGRIRQAHAINYSFMISPVFYALEGAEEVFRFTHNGYLYQISGDHMYNLLRLINLRKISELVEGENYKIDGIAFSVDEVIIEPINEDDSEPLANDD